MSGAGRSSVRPPARLVTQIRSTRANGEAKRAACPRDLGSVWGEHAFATHLGWLGLAYLMPLVMRV